MEYLLYNLSGKKAAREDERLLDDDEREQYARRGERYLIVRALLKKELARRCGMAPGDIRFCYNEHGKPSFEQQHFNISHSGNLLCMAFHHADVGVDIQQIRPVRRMESLARRIMCEQQLEIFREQGSRTEDFFTCWCIAEALVKLHAATIWDALRYPFIYKNGRVSTAETLPSVKIHLFTPAEGFCGAIAMRTEA